MEISGQNWLLSIVGRTIDLSAVTSDRFKIHVQPSINRPWYFERFYAAWDSTADDPSVFSDITFKIVWNSHDHHIPATNTIDLSCTTTPGLNDLTAGTTRPKQFFWKSPRIGWQMAQQDVFEFTIENYLGAGKPDELELMFYGKRIFEKVF